MRPWICSILLMHLTATVSAEKVKDYVTAQFAECVECSEKTPYSKTIKGMHIGYSETGQPTVGVAYREIKTFKPIVGVVVVERRSDGFYIKEAAFPEIMKIRNPKDRQQITTILHQFKNQPFDPNAEKSAVDAVSGATKYSLRVSGYFNYLARKTALEMKKDPNWKRIPIN